MTVEQFEAQLGDLGEDLDNLQTILTEIAGRVVDEMKAEAPVATGDLKRSIKAIVTDSQIQLAMLNYGVFQNYGVDGMSQQVADEVPQFGIEPQPANGRRFGFSGDYTMIGGDLPIGARRKIYQFGLKPQTFFNLDDISDTIVEYVADRLTENNF